MPGSTLSSAALDERRRRILFRAWRRGMRELDLVMGAFADAHLSRMSEVDLDAFERLLEESDTDVLAWIMEETPLPAAYDTLLFARLRAAPAASVDQAEPEK